ncbi:hypothetical protein [Halopenitus sp. POP-27]|uniref:hypothetical protein n=1 Tax=Halopenitus sp. POP-27 TaxID=2994425 RepID=UPI002468B1F3|nr:hypothetical protein [Halopenitus sp. POP-27]
MTTPALLPIVAAIAAIVVAVARRLSILLIELSGSVPSPVTISAATVGGRAVAFLAVYGLVLATAYLVARGTPDEPALRTDRILAAGSAAALAHLLVAVGLLALIELSQPWIVTGATVVGTSVAAGVRIAVVTVAGLALGARR